MSLFRPTISAEVEESGSLVPDGLPADDAAGEDLADPPRFPGAVRLEYRIDTQAAENGWSLAELEYSLGEWVFHITSDDRAAVIELDPRQKRLIEIELELRIPAHTWTASPPP